MTDITVLKAALGALEDIASAKSPDSDPLKFATQSDMRDYAAKPIPALRDLITRMEAKPVADGLLPCPFCGGAAEIKSRKTTFVQCTKCGASIFQKLNNRNSALKAWNKRKQP